MNEQELARRLSNAANIAPSATSPFDMTMSTSTTGRPRALLVAPALAGLLIAGGIGFVAGRNTSGFDPASTPGTTVAATSVPDSVADSTPDGSAPNTVESTPADDSEATIDAVDPEYVEQMATEMGYETFTPVLERMVGDIRVRVGEGEPYEASGNFEEGSGDPSVDNGSVRGVFFEPAPFDPPPGCSTEVSTRYTIDGPDVVDSFGWTRRPNLTTDPVFNAVPLGFSDRSPFVLVDVEGDAASASATISTSAGDVTETADFVDGRALLLLPANGFDFNQLYSDSTDETFDVVKVTATLADGSTQPIANQEFVFGATCEPPDMPAAGEQPADADATYAEVEASFDRLVDPTIPQGDKEPLLNDWTGVADAVEAAQTGNYADAVANAKLTITDHVFTSPTEMWFTYTVSAPTGSFGFYGVANLVDGTWQFRREMMCESLSLASDGCVPNGGLIGPAPRFSEEPFGD